MNLKEIKSAAKRLLELEEEDQALCKFWLRINHSYQTLEMDGYEIDVDEELVDLIRAYVDRRQDRVRAEIKVLNDSGIYIDKPKRKTPFITKLKEYIICKLK